MAHSHLHKVLRERIQQEIDKLASDLVHNAALDHKLAVGQVLGMETCMKICDEIEGEFDERSSST